MATRPSGLGRGIASLIPTTSAEPIHQKSREFTATDEQDPVQFGVPESHPESGSILAGTVLPEATVVEPKVPAAKVGATDNIVALHPSRKPTVAQRDRTGVGSTSAGTADTDAHTHGAKAHSANSSDANDMSPSANHAAAQATRRRPIDVFFTSKPAESAGASAGEPAGETETELSRRVWDEAATSGRLGLTKPERSEPGLKPVSGIRYGELIVDLIKPNPWQPRAVFDETELAELAASIAEIGLLQPIVVRERPDGYELIMGERRWRAAQRAGLRKIPALIRNTEDTAMLRDALLENLHRANLNPLEEATAYRQLLDDFGCTQEELATRIAKSRSQIANTLRLLKLPPLIQKRLAKGDLQAGHARAILGLVEPEAMEMLAQRVVAEGLSVRAVEEMVAAATDATPQGTSRTRTLRSMSTPETEQLAVRLSERFAAKVNVRIGAVGRVTIEFDDLANLNRILALIAPDDPGVDQTS